MRESTEHIASIVKRLRDQGYRLTPQRMAILRAILESTTHPTAEEIHQQVSTDFPMLSLATVYKTLHVLKELGVITELKVDGRGRYDHNIPPHPHLVCVHCGAIIDLPPETMPKLPQEVLAGQGFDLLWYDVVAYGLCSRCSEGDETL